MQGIYESGAEQSCTSGSGSGAPLLAQRTVASNIHLYEIIGNYITLLRIIYRTILSYQIRLWLIIVRIYKIYVLTCLLTYRSDYSLCELFHCHTVQSVRVGPVA